MKELLIATLTCVFTVFVARQGSAADIAVAGPPIQLTFDLADDVEPSWSPLGGKIAFASYRTGSEEIYVLDLTTGIVAAVTNNGNRNWHPDWSPDGQLICYTGGPGSDQIWVSTPDGAVASPVTTSGAHRHPDWSPDGTEFLYTAAIGTEGPIRRIDADGIGTPSTVVSSGWYADWSSDGSKIVFARYGGGGQLFLVDPDGSNLRNISTSGNYHAYPAFSPDGNLIACSITKNGDPEICIIDTNGNEVLQVTDNTVIDIYPTWSPEGNAISFVSSRSGNSDIWKVELEGLVGDLPVALDIKPGSCPNPFNVKPYVSSEGGSQGMAAGGRPDVDRLPARGPKKAVLPAAILGSANFDVSNINPATVMLNGVDLVRYSYEDVTTPADQTSDACACNEIGGDGYEDMTLKFYRDDIVASLGEVADGDIISLTVTGELYDGTPIEGSDCIVIIYNDKDDDEGDEMVVVVNEPPSSSNYPNPFNPTTEISFSLPDAGHVTLEIFNIVGQRIEVLVDGTRETGHHVVEWDAGRYASGVYLYRLTAGDFVETRRMVLVK